MTNAWFNVAAFALARPPGRTATAGRNILDGPGRKIVDLAIFRDFQIRERMKLQFRLEMTNAFNLVNLNAPTTDAELLRPSAPFAPRATCATCRWGCGCRSDRIRRGRLGDYGRPRRRIIPAPATGFPASGNTPRSRTTSNSKRPGGNFRVRPQLLVAGEQEIRVAVIAQDEILAQVSELAGGSAKAVCSPSARTKMEAKS